MAVAKKIEVDKQIVFNSTLIDEVTNKINDGVLLKRYQNPWLKGEVGIRRPSVSFAMTLEEQEEYIKCALDIHHFAEKYCKTKIEDGSVGNIMLRDYQKEMLDSFFNNRFNILCAARQCGKCLTYNTLIELEKDNEVISIRLGRLYYDLLKEIRPLTILEKIKIKLYDVVSFLEKYNSHQILTKAVEFIEHIAYRNMRYDENDISKKIINSIKTEGYKIKTDTGYKPVNEIHITQPYTHWEITTRSGYKLVAADNHILFKEGFVEVYMKDLIISDMIYTEIGLDALKSIKMINAKTSMFDISVDDDNHRFYSNGILSHNTISSSIFILHFLIFNNDKNSMIIANKGDTVIEIVDKIKSIYTLLPFFLKPGVKVWNQKSLSLENGCRIKTSARTKTPAVGFTIDLLYLDEFAHIPTNIIEPFYTAAFPTVSAVQNSKIIITSTPNGMNLFHKILTDSERPAGDSKKNNFKGKRVYWYQVPGRFVTYIRLNEHRMYEHGVDRDFIFDIVQKKWGHLTKVVMKWNVDLQLYIISVFNNDVCSDSDVKSMMFNDSNDYEVSFHAIAEITTWKEEAIKDIGSEDGFNQEYDLRFINGNKSSLNESIIDELLKNKKNYKYSELDELSKLKFRYDDLLWVDDELCFTAANRKNYKVVFSVDIAEGLGQDYSIINIFRVREKDLDYVTNKQSNYENISDFYKLEQIGIYRSNFISIKQLAELLYSLVFEYFEPDNVKVVLELNNYGNTLLAEMPHVLDGENVYGSYVFVRYKHRLDATEEKVGLKVGENKNLMVKDYQDMMYDKTFSITYFDNITEITTFVKQTTTAGNIRYAGDGNSHDDMVMTIVNTTSFLKKYEYREFAEEYHNIHNNIEFREFVNNCMKNKEFTQGVDYSQLLNIRKTYMNRNKMVKENRNIFGSKLI